MKMSYYDTVHEFARNFKEMGEEYPEVFDLIAQPNIKEVKKIELILFQQRKKLIQ